MPFPEQSGDFVYVSADAYPIQSVSENIVTRFPDNTIEFPGSLTNAYMQLTQTDGVKSVCDSTLTPFKDYKLSSNEECTVRYNRSTFAQGGGGPENIANRAVVDDVRADLTFNGGIVEARYLPVVSTAGKENLIVSHPEAKHRRRLIFDSDSTHTLKGGLAQSRAQVIPNSNATVVFSENMALGLWKTSFRDKSGSQGRKTDVIANPGDINIEFTLPGKQAIVQRLFSYATFDRGNANWDATQQTDEGGNQIDYIIGDGSINQVLYDTNTSSYLSVTPPDPAAANLRTIQIYPGLEITNIQSRVVYQLLRPTDKLPQMIDYYIDDFKIHTRRVQLTAGEDVRVSFGKIGTRQMPESIIFYAVPTRQYTTNRPIDWGETGGAYFKGLQISSNMAPERITLLDSSRDQSAVLLNHTKRQFPLYRRKFGDHKRDHIVAVHKAQLGVRHELPGLTHYEIRPDLILSLDTEYLARFAQLPNGANQEGGNPYDNGALAYDEEFDIHCVLSMNNTKLCMKSSGHGVYRSTIEKKSW